MDESRSYLLYYNSIFLSLYIVGLITPVAIIVNEPQHNRPHYIFSFIALLIYIIRTSLAGIWLRNYKRISTITVIDLSVLMIDIVYGFMIIVFSSSIALISLCVYVFFIEIVIWGIRIYTLTTMISILDDEKERNKQGESIELLEIKIASGNDECAICLDIIEKGSEIRGMPACTHEFHKDCIEKWLEKKATCPKCRDNLLLPETTQLMVL